MQTTQVTLPRRSARLAEKKIEQPNEKVSNIKPRRLRIKTEQLFVQETPETPQTPETQTQTQPPHHPYTLLTNYWKSHFQTSKNVTSKHLRNTFITNNLVFNTILSPTPYRTTYSVLQSIHKSLQDIIRNPAILFEDQQLLLSALQQIDHIKQEKEETLSAVYPPYKQLQKTCDDFLTMCTNQLRKLPCYEGYKIILVERIKTMLNKVEEARGIHKAKNSNLIYSTLIKNPIFLVLNKKFLQTVILKKDDLINQMDDKLQEYNSEENIKILNNYKHDLLHLYKPVLSLCAKFFLYV